MNRQLFRSVYYTDEELGVCGFRALGRNVMIHETAIIFGIENISMGNHIRIDPYVSIIATGPITIGSFVHIGSYCFLSGREGIIMGDFTGLSQGVKIYTRSDDYSGLYLTNPTIPEKYRGMKKGPVLLEKHVIIGSGSVILPDITIGEGSSVGALALVTKSLPKWGIFSGIPARRLKARSQELRKLEAALLQETQHEKN